MDDFDYIQCEDLDQCFRTGLTLDIGDDWLDELIRLICAGSKSS